MQFSALKTAALMGGGDGTTDGDEVQLIAAPAQTTSLNGTQWSFLLLAAFIGYFIQRGRGGIANVVGWTLIVGAILIALSASIGLANAMNTVGGWISALGGAITWFGDALQNSA